MSNIYKIVVDGTVLAMALDNKLARTGVYFVIKNLCDSLMKRKDVELKIISSVALKKKLLEHYRDHQYAKCLNTDHLKPGIEKLNFIFPFHPPNSGTLKLSNSNFFQIIYDFSAHMCTELKKNNIAFEKRIIETLKSKIHPICISEQTKKDLANISKIPLNNIGVFYPGLRHDLYNFDNKNFNYNNDNINNFLKIPKNAKYLLCLSTIEPRKNLNSSLRVFKKICENLKSQDLYLVLTGAKGWGSEENFFKDLPIEIKKRIILTGYVDDEIVSKLYKSSLCFLYPSFYEGFGLPPLEAIACGTPIIISNRGSLPEIFKNVAEVFDPYDIDGMSSVIINWFLNPNERLIQINKSKNFTKNFTWSNSVNQLMKYISSFE